MSPRARAASGAIAGSHLGPDANSTTKRYDPPVRGVVYARRSRKIGRRRLALITVVAAGAAFASGKPVQLRAGQYFLEASLRVGSYIEAKEEPSRPEDALRKRQPSPSGSTPSAAWLDEDEFDLLASASGAGGVIEDLSEEPCEVGASSA